MNKYPYDTTYDPPLPVCHVALKSPTTEECVILTAVVDTGADATIVPLRYLHQVGARRAYEAQLRSHWGERRTVFLHVVELQIGEVSLPGIYAVGDELGDDVVLGRDVLNRLRLLLDGPAEMMELLT
jgi:predicted aspartyl protease